MNMLWLLLILMALFMPLVASGQQWQDYQLTHSWPGWGVCNYDAVLDSSGNLQIYAVYDTSALFRDRTYYSRHSLYGQMLTDTVWLDPPGIDSLSPSQMKAGQDEEGGTWCLWADGPYGPSFQYDSVYLTRRDQYGIEVLARHAVGYITGTGGWQDVDAARCALDNTLILAGGYGSYDRITMAGNIIEWERPFSDPRESAGTRLCTASDGTVWAATSQADGWPADIVMYHFGPDTGLTSYYPFGHSESLRWGSGELATDPFGNFHMLVGNDTVSLAYVIFDSTFAMMEWRSLLYTWGSGASLGVNGEGDCLIVWTTLAGTPQWAMHSLSEGWVVEPTTFSTTQAFQFRVIASDSGRWIVTAGQQSNIYAFLYGFPPNSSPEPPRGVFANDLRIYPNPFNSTTTLTFALRTPAGVDLALYDLLGRRVLSLAHEIRSAGEYRIAVDGTRFPSGVYVVRMQAGDVVNAQKLLLLK